MYFLFNNRHRQQHLCFVLVVACILSTFEVWTDRFLDTVKSISTCKISLLMMDKSRMCRAFLFFFCSGNTSLILPTQLSSLSTFLLKTVQNMHFSQTGKYFNVLFMVCLYPVSFVFTGNYLIRFQHYTKSNEQWGQMPDPSSVRV